jgi:ABC-type multidrug transport system fused ATPase/permease subunit
MRLPQAFLGLDRLSTPRVVQRGVVVSALVLFERLLAPAATWAFFGGGVSSKLAFGFGFGCVLSSRTFLQHAFRARTEADLFERLVTSLIEGDVLRTNVLPDEDARSELGQAAYHATQSVSVDLPLLLADGIAAAILGVFIVIREPGRLVALAIGLAVMGAAALFATRRTMEKTLAGAWTAQQRVYEGFVDALEGRLEVVASGRRASFLEQMHARTRSWAIAGVRVAAEVVLSSKLPLLAIAVALTVLAGLLSARYRVTFPVSTADIALLLSTTPAFLGVAQGILATARSKRWIGIVARILDEPPIDRTGTRAAPQLPAVIAFERVSFRYEGALSEALRDVSFAWGPGRVLALAGANGSGKSTCLRLLLLLSQTRAGRITVGGESLREIDADAWTACVAFLTQRPYLPPRSDVRAAVHFLAPDAADERIERALDRVGLLEFLRTVAEHPLAVRVDTLSVGQRQRVALARLLCQDASLVLLDEPDANLDRAGIALVAELVRELAGKRMVAVAAHSAELLEVADRVVELKNGRVIRDEPRVVWS